jgi:hypothetical protein
MGGSFAPNENIMTGSGTSLWLSHLMSVPSGERIEAVKQTSSDKTRIADPTLASSMLQRRNDFPQAPIVAKIMGFLGSNVFCVSFPNEAFSVHWKLTCCRQMVMNGELAILSLHTPG